MLALSVCLAVLAGCSSEALVLWRRDAGPQGDAGGFRDAGMDGGPVDGGAPAVDGGIDAGTDGGSDGGPPIIRVTPPAGTDDRVWSYYSISADGRYVAFATPASTLVTNDTNGVSDIFLYDAADGAVTRVTSTPTGEQTDGHSVFPNISADGRLLAFASDASNLVPGDVGGVRDVFVRDLSTSNVVRISEDASAVGADGECRFVRISGDGRYVVYSSLATNLVIGDENGVEDVFRYDRTTRTTVRVSVHADGTESAWAATRPSISYDGRFVVFDTRAQLAPGDADDLNDVLVWDGVDGSFERISIAHDGSPPRSSSVQGDISRDGDRVLFRSYATNLVPDDTNGMWDMFVRHRGAAQTERVSLGEGGVEPDGNSIDGSISGDGQVVTFSATATNLVPGDDNGAGDIFVRRLDTGVVFRVEGPFGAPNGASQSPVIDETGTCVAFRSLASNLVPGEDGDMNWDLFRFCRPW